MNKIARVVLGMVAGRFLRTPILSARNAPENPVTAPDLTHQYDILVTAFAVWKLVCRIRVNLARLRHYAVPRRLTIRDILLQPSRSAGGRQRHRERDCSQ